MLDRAVGEVRGHRRHRGRTSLSSATSPSPAPAPAERSSADLVGSIRTTTRPSSPSSQRAAIPAIPPGIESSYRCRRTAAPAGSAPGRYAPSKFTLVSSFGSRSDGCSSTAQANASSPRTSPSAQQKHRPQPVSSSSTSASPCAATMAPSVSRLSASLPTRQCCTTGCRADQSLSTEPTIPARLATQPRTGASGSTTTKCAAYSRSHQQAPPSSSVPREDARMARGLADTAAEQPG